ncbi:glycosyltransferase [Waterburya agarophytonicola K14]|uniref:Glycosyltransferase n=1 Tax=Waterburya agarophytonicola KI4 TaxID=2874699 RepID=A0A964BPX8_9CYAN|nr:glycosyltransferase [Waterburya agarophytonicola]MCC0177423.1 glycosyltransferase [Waterburya agarophytonicola KI4]
MKIVYLTTGLNMGGAEVMLYNLLSKIDRDLFEPTIISLMDKGVFGEQIEQLGIPVHSAGMLVGKPSLASVKKVVGLIKQAEPDLIQGWMYHGNLAAQFFNFVSGKKTPVLWSIHHSLHDLPSEKPLTQGIIRFGSWSSKYVSKVAYVSEKSQGQHQKIGYDRENSCVVPNGFDISKFQPSAEIRQKFRQELGISDDTFLIGSLARYHPMKDHANLLKAAKVLLAEYPDTKFVLIGTNVDSENSALTDLIAELDISKSVYLLGQRRDIPQITPALDILTSSSAFGEAFPLVIGEAMACGIPCVVTDIGDSGWIVGDTGKAVPPKDPNALAQGWKEIINLEPDARAEKSQAARNRIVEKFALDSIVKEYEHIYQSVVN